MTKETAIKLFEQKQIRSIWREDNEKWYFSIIDVIEVLTGTDRPRKYWNDLKAKLRKEGSELSDKIGQLKLIAESITSEISKAKEPNTFEKNRIIAHQGGTIAGNTRREIEEKTGRNVVTGKNAKQLEEKKNKSDE